MINQIFQKYNNLDIKIKKILKIGLLFSFMLSIISTVFLFTYLFLINLQLIFNIGLFLFKFSLILISEFLICSIIVDSISKDFI